MNYEKEKCYSSNSLEFLIVDMILTNDHLQCSLNNLLRIEILNTR